MTVFIGASIETGEDEPDVVDGVTGAMSVVANFDSSEITGTGSDFFENRIICPETGCGDGLPELGQYLGGTLDFAGNITSAGFTGDLTGTLTGDYSDEGIAGTFSSVVDMEGDGGFLEDPASLMAGAELFGTPIITVTTADDTFVEILDYDGNFLVTNQPDTSVGRSRRRATNGPYALLYTLAFALDCHAKFNRAFFRGLRCGPGNHGHLFFWSSGRSGATGR